MSDQKPRRPLRDGECDCKHGCQTICTLAVPSCGMCSSEAIAEREALHKARVEAKELSDLEVATNPDPKPEPKPEPIPFVRKKRH